MTMPRVTTDLRQIAARVCTVCQRVLGVPDYDAYLQHLAIAHPGTTPLAREEFERERLDARYSRPGGKCC